jgi:hypothetical protein
MMGRPVFEPRTGRPGLGVFAMRLLAGVTRALAPRRSLALWNQ